MNVTLEGLDKALNLKFWLFQAVAMGLTALAIPRLRITSIFGAILIVVALAFVNIHLWDAALFLKVPDSVTAQSLTLIATNGALFWALVKLLPGIETDGLLPALVAPIVFSLLSVLVTRYMPLINWPLVWSETQRVFNSLRQQVS